MEVKVWPVSPVSGFTPLPASPVKALIAPRNMLSLILSRWPRTRSQAPAGEMWSVVVLPLVLTRMGSSMKSFPSQRGNGCRSWSRSLFGRMSTATRSPSAAGAS